MRSDTAFALLILLSFSVNQNPRLILALFDQMQAENMDTKVRQNILGTLQKLSLLRAAQSVMIDLGW